MAGKPDTKINLELLDDHDNTLKLELVQAAASSVRELEFEARKLAGHLGYIKFNLFFGDLLPKFQTALQDLSDTKTLIIDLRGNPGGAGDLAPAIANLLCTSSGSLGSLKYRYETTEYSYAGSGGRAYKGRIIILTDEGTGSTSEVFTGGLQTSKRAVVIGSPSAGAVLPSLAQLLPTGGALQYVVSNFQTAQGVALEGKGVIPDAAIKSTRADFLAGRDSVLEKAISFAERGSI
jgi:carboxyl-terminal processing protease